MGYLDLARGRYSCRSFEDRSVEQAVVDAMLRLGVLLLLLVIIIQPV